MKYKKIYIFTELNNHLCIKKNLTTIEANTLDNFNGYYEDHTLF